MSASRTSGMADPKLLDNDVDSAMVSYQGQGQSQIPNRKPFIAPSSSSLANPPSYHGRQEPEYEMSDIPLGNPSDAATAPGAPGSKSNAWNFDFFKPKKNKRWPPWVLGLTAAVVIAIIATSTAFAIKGGVSERHAQTCESSLSSLVSHTPTSTKSTPSTSTEKDEAPNLKITVTATPFSNPTSIPACWGILKSICSNNTQIPADGKSEGFGECTEIYRYFYCGMITNLQNSGNSAIKDPNNLICANFKEFCVNGKPAAQPQPSQGITNVVPTATSAASGEKVAVRGLFGAFGGRALPTAGPKKDNVVQTWTK